MLQAQLPSANTAMVIWKVNNLIPCIVLPIKLLGVCEVPEGELKSYHSDLDKLVMNSIMTKQCLCIRVKTIDLSLFKLIISVHSQNACLTNEADNQKCVKFVSW